MRTTPASWHGATVICIVPPSSRVCPCAAALALSALS